MIGGKENAASRGELRFPLPVGYIYDPDGRTIMDPNEEIQHAVATLFKAFRTTGALMVLSGISQKTAFPFPNALMEVPGMGRSPGGL